MQNPKIPMSMRSYTYVLGCSSLAKTSFLDYSDLVNPAATSIPTNLHLYWNHFHFFSFSVAWWCFRKFRTVLKYDRSCLNVRPYSNKSPTMIFWCNIFSPRSWDIVSHSIFSFILIAKNVEAAFRSPIGITFHRRFTHGVNNDSISCAPFLCQYLPINTVHVQSNIILCFCVNVLYRIIAESSGGGGWVCDLIQFLVGHTQTPLVLMT